MVASVQFAKQPNAFYITCQDVKALCAQGRLKEALDILNAIGYSIDFSTYVSLLQGCIKNKSLSQGKLIHAHIKQTGCLPDRFLFTTLINMYAKCGSLAEARRVFDQMPKRDEFTWTAMIGAYAKQGLVEEALALFRRMQRTGIQLNQFIFASVLPACTNLAVLNDIHEEIVRHGFQFDAFVGSALVDMYGKCGSLEIARDVFDKMSEPNIVSRNAMIAGYSRNGLMEEALELFEKMPRQDVFSWNEIIAGYAQNGQVDKALHFFRRMPQRDMVSWNTMISAYIQIDKVEDALKLFEEMPRQDVVSWSAMIVVYAQNGEIEKALELFQKTPEPDTLSWNAMITGYVQNGNFDEALELFQKMPTPNVVSWNAMLAGYAQNGLGEEALKLYQQMQLAGVKPDSKTFASVLQACADLAALEEGIEIHEKIIKRGLQFDVSVANALVDMYAKCGSIEKAREVFDKMHSPNTVCWTAIISGYSMHGCGDEVFKLFEQMRLSGISPDHVTFICVLSACCHAGLVEKGLEYFDCMSHYYNLKPAMEHYAGIVDLLGRAGHFDEAREFINKMPIKPDANVWGCLLGACRVHNNVEVGESVAKQMFELDPDNAAPYVMLSNLYATTGRWDDTEKVRKLMKEGRVIKTPGCSRIEVNKRVHILVVGEISHSQMQKIYEELERLDRLPTQMKLAGYVPDTRLCLTMVMMNKRNKFFATIVESWLLHLGFSTCCL